MEDIELQLTAHDRSALALLADMYGLGYGEVLSMYKDGMDGAQLAAAVRRKRMK